MNLPKLYIAIAIVVLAIIAVIILRKSKKSNEKMTVLSALAFAFIFAGIIFGEMRTAGYSLMAVGGVLALIDIIKKLKNNSPR